MTESKTLEQIARALLAPERTLAELLPEAERFRDWLEARTAFRIDQVGDISVGESRLEHGLAISPVAAAMCARELFRTTAFIRGLGQAVDESLRPDRPVRVLYAGCGPYALLALPLMAAFPAGQVVFTLLDIHQECLDAACRLIDSLGLAGHVAAVHCTDAVRFRIPATAVPDVIVSETMSVALRNEPQVSIARNLLVQAPAARMVPRAVHIEACLLDPGKEIAGVPPEIDGEPPEAARDRIPLGTVFTLDADSIRVWTALTGDRLPGGTVTLPAPLTARHRPFLLTKIDVYGEQRLQDYDSSLTLPRPWPGKPVFSGGETLRFHYRISDRPELGYEIVEKTNR